MDLFVIEIKMSDNTILAITVSNPKEN